MINKIHLMDNQEGIAKLADKSVNLIIADPPYYKIKGDFDFEFKDFQEYQDFMEEQAKIYKRVLADNGSLFVYGHAKNIAYVQIIFDKYFNLVNNLVLEKQKLKIEMFDLRSFPERTQERILFYSNEIGQTGLEKILEENIKPLHPFAKYLQEEFKKAGVTNKEISKLFPSATGGLTGCVSNWLNGDNVITENQYNTIRKYLGENYLRREYEDLRREYESLRQEYESLRRPFNNFKRLTDVMRYSQESHITRQFDHDTIKPEKLTLDLIETTTKENDLVLIPFGGSGTECVCSMRLKRRWVAFENKKKYFDIALKRIHSEYEKTSLFNSLGGRQDRISA